MARFDLAGIADMDEHVLRVPFSPLRYAVDQLGDLFRGLILLVRNLFKPTGNRFVQTGQVGTDEELIQEFADAFLIGRKRLKTCLI